MNCGVCGRSKKQVIEDCIVESKVESSTEVEVFYITTSNQLVCPRCISEKLVPVGLNGNPYLKYYPYHKKSKMVQGITINKDIIVTEDSELDAQREAARIEARDRIERMMSQI